MLPLPMISRSCLRSSIKAGGTQTLNPAWDATNAPKPAPTLNPAWDATNAPKPAPTLNPAWDATGTPKPAPTLGSAWPGCGLVTGAAQPPQPRAQAGLLKQNLLSQPPRGSQTTNRQVNDKAHPPPTAQQAPRDGDGKPREGAGRWAQGRNRCFTSTLGPSPGSRPRVRNIRRERVRQPKEDRPRDQAPGRLAGGRPVGRDAGRGQSA
jgi:hypothetical protein